MSDARVSLLPPLAWMVLIFALSSQSSIPHPSGLSDDLQAVVAHLFLFGVLALLVINALALWIAELPRRSVLTVLFTSIYGVTDEIHQSFVAGRDASGLDVLVDATAAVIAVAMFVVVQRRVRQAPE